MISQTLLSSTKESLELPAPDTGHEWVLEVHSINSKIIGDLCRSVLMHLLVYFILFV